MRACPESTLPRAWAWQKRALSTILTVLITQIPTQTGYQAVTKQASPMTQMVKDLPVMQEARVLSLGQEDPLVKGMTTHPSILAWRIPWPEEAGRLRSTGLQRVGHG